MIDFREKNIGYWGRRIMAGLKTRIEERIEPYEITFPEAIVMIILSHKGPSSLVEISRIIEHAHPTVLRVIDTLEEKGFIIRSPHPEDRRVKLVSLTDHAKRMAEKVHREFIAVNVMAREGIPDEEFESAVDTFRKICNNLDSKDPLEEILKNGKL